MHAMKVALPPKSEAPRKTGPSLRGATNYVNSNASDDNTTALRLQRLRLLGVIGQRASVLAGLVWEIAA